MCGESCKKIGPTAVNDLNLFGLGAKKKTHRDGQLVSQWRDVDMKVVIEPIFNSQSYFQQVMSFIYMKIFVC